jgi:hypothetical protein
MALLAARTPRSSDGRAADFESAARGFDPHRGDHFDGRMWTAVELFNNLGTRFEPVLARFIPIRRLARRTDSWLTLGAFAGYPFVRTAITFIPFLPEGDQSHDVTIPRY